MSKTITGPRVLSGFRPETMQTPAGRTGHLEALCAHVRRAFEAQGKVHPLAWIWVQQNPDGAATPAILAVEIAGEINEAFEARVRKACDLGKALAVATVTAHEAVQVLFETYAGSEVLHATIRAGNDPLHPASTLRALEPFGPGELVPERFARALHEPR